MTNRTAKQVVTQAISDFDDIKDAIEGHRIPVPYPTKTSEYARLIGQIRVGSVSGFATYLPAGDCVNSLSGDLEVYPKGFIIGYVIGNMESAEEEE